MAKEEKTFLIGDLAEELDVQPATARGMLRAAKVEKTGKQYEWSKTAFDKVVRQLKAEKKADEKATAKPAKKDVAKKGKAKAEKEMADA
jgi:hypothetical protein